jgi:uncharacterized protein YtpQ (UPF0354 family)
MGLKSGSTDSGLDEDADSEETTDASTQSAESIPYTYRRDSVNGDRDQIPFFLREDVLDAEQDFLRSLEDRLGEEVYKSDAREAAIVLAHRNPDLVADVLREWGYDLD